jgi:hypothetical protein
LALLSVFGQANPPRQVAAAYRISGVVVDAVTNVPVARAEVSISLRNEQVSTVAGDDGRFAFEGLEAGKYVLNAAAPGYVREGYHQHGAFLVAIATGNGQDSEHLVFRLHPQAVIYGRVIDERGEALRGAQVALFASDLTRGSHAKFSRAQMQTNDLGEYRFAHLLPGRYYLAVQARPWYAQTLLSVQKRDYEAFAGSVIGGRSERRFVSVSSPDVDPALDVVYPITFYPSATEERSCAELVLSAGEKEEADITLQAVPATHLRLTGVSNDEGTSVGVGASQRVFGTFNGLNAVSGQTSPGEYEIAGLPPGNVTLMVMMSKGNEQTSRTIEVDTRSGGAIDTAEFQMTAKVSGRIVDPGGAVETRAGFVSLMSTASETLQIPPAQIQKGGTFNFPEVQPGTYRIQVNLPAGDYYVQKVSAKEAKVSGREITVVGGNDVDLTVTLGQGLGRVMGTVQLDGKPAAAVLVLLVPESGQGIEEDSRMDESDSDGTFSLGGIFPGDYVLMAINDGWDLEWAKPGALRSYLLAGQKMSIAPNQSVRVTVSAQEKTATMEKKPR